MASAITIRPGVFVHLKTSITGGNTTYTRTDLAVEEETDGTPVVEVVDANGKKRKSKKRKWVTDSTTLDVEEAERASDVRTAASGLVNSVTYQTALGRTCRREDRATLEVMIAKAEEMVDNFNATATITRIGWYAVPINVEADDTRAMKMITQELGEMLKQMDKGITTFDVKKIRAIATQAQAAANALDAGTQEKVQAAVDQARKAANTIARRITKDGEDKAKVLQDIQRGLIEGARIAFLDMGEAPEPVEALPAVQAQRFADLDLSPVECTTAEAVNRPQLDLSDSDDGKTMAATSVRVATLDLL
jgi:cytochrome c556